MKIKSWYFIAVGLVVYIFFGFFIIIPNRIYDLFLMGYTVGVALITVGVYEMVIRTKIKELEKLGEKNETSM